ncbi:hypothetical protein C3B55_00695 [Candidatus Pseudomonas adelgestsugas]|uniref:Uncharacterized protein n=1 Tax=Candidatus Pseudomonas adelgestsugas TaxID=1302376 RepID=A0ABX5R9Q4_9PSED|nr:hypothetical protein C3B55_00695 [Candidatus Pseudomonas adelgestsugas]
MRKIIGIQISEIFGNLNNLASTWFESQLR